MATGYLSNFAVSSPGKVILFGEHAAVYNKPAIAAAVSLRTYLLVLPNKVEENHERTIRLEFPDIKLEFECLIDDLPWEIVERANVTQESDPTGAPTNGQKNSQFILTPPTSASIENKSSLPAESLDSPELEINEKLIEALQPIIRRVTDTFQHAALFAFFYLYLNICTRETPGYTFTTKSTLPVGAGLGSSATFSVCLSTAFLAIGKKLSIPNQSPLETQPEQQQKQTDVSIDTLMDTPPVTPMLVDEVKSTDATSTTNLGNDDHNLINKWAYIGEKCLHGNPSGIDNTVACRGGAVLFQRPCTMVPIKKFPELRLVLTNTKQPRRTKDLVDLVAKHVERHPGVVGDLLNCIAQVTNGAYEILDDGNGDDSLDSESFKRLLQYVRINHGLLYSLGVSHYKLEIVKQVGDELEIGETKLTGAGGGGCAITLLYAGPKPSPLCSIENVLEKKAAAAARLQEFKKRLESEEHGFEVFETTLGGPGVGIVSDLGISSERFLQLKRESLESLNWKYWG